MGDILNGVPNYELLHWLLTALASLVMSVCGLLLRWLRGDINAVVGESKRLASDLSDLAQRVAYLEGQLDKQD